MPTRNKPFLGFGHDDIFSEKTDVFEGLEKLALCQLKVRKLR